jgi:hypothetical protein
MERTITRRLDLRGAVKELGYPCELVDGEKDVFRFIIEKAH